MNDSSEIQSAKGFGIFWYIKGESKDFFKCICSAGSLRYRAIIFLMGVLVVIHLCITNFAPFGYELLPALKGLMSLIVAVLLFFLWAYHLLNNKEAVSEYREKFSYAGDVLLEVIIGALFSYFLYAAHIVEHVASAQDFLIVFVVAITALSLQIVSKAAGLAGYLLSATENSEKAASSSTLAANESRDSTNKVNKFLMELTSINNTLQLVVGDAKNTALLAGLLEQKAQSIDGQSESFKDAVRSGLDTTKRWVKTGVAIQDPSQSDAWWRMMETYNREERYDIARGEIVTNVRNYAFIIVRLIHQQILAVDRHNKENPEQKKKVIIAQVTPFSPKDFYNFPNGSRGNRFYFDQEFFGTYRRLLSHYLRHENVYVKRALLCRDNKDAKRSLGWALDDPLQMYAHCKGFNIIPTSVPVDYKNNASQDVEKLLSDRLCNNKFDPAKILKSEKGCYSWVPVYPDPSFIKNLSKRYSYRGCNNLESTLDELFSVKIKDGKLVYDRDNYQDGFSLHELNFKTARKADECWSALEKAVGEANNQSALSENCSAIKHLAADWATLQQHKNSIDNDSNFEVITRELFSITPVVQRVDALLADLFEDHSASKSSTGQPIGMAELWFYWWLAILESKDFMKTKSGTLPTVWDRFSVDLLGETEPIVDEDKILDSFRIVPLSGKAGDNFPESIDYIVSHGVMSEFVLIGTQDLTQSEPEWKTFIGAEMSDPFQAARVMFGFSNKKIRGEELLSLHGAWFSEIWENSKVSDVNANFAKALSKNDSEAIDKIASCAGYTIK